MAVEVVGFEMVQGPVENGAEGGKPVLHEKENGKPVQDLGASEAIKFGTHGDESTKGEGNDALDANAPKDAVEEWPAPKQIHSFYFVRWRPFDDPTIKSKIDHLDKEISKINQGRSQITEALKAKRSERAELIAQIKALKGDRRQFQSLVDDKIKEIEPLQQALGKLRTTSNAGRGGLCSSEEELNSVIYSLQYRIQHESIPLSEEKQLLREIKQLEGTRDKVIANAAMRAKLQESMGQQEAIQDQVKLIGGDLNGVKKERQAIQSKIKQIDDALKTVDKDIQSLQDELAAVTQKREKSFESMHQLKKQREEGNTHFYQSRTLLNIARELAAKKDINALDEVSQTEVEKFMALWNSDKNFRKDYEKRILASLDMRQLSRDGRMRNPDEKPLLEEPKPVETDAFPKTVPKQTKEEPKPPPQETLPAEKESKKNKGRDLKSKPDIKDLAETDEYEFENPQKETPAKEPEIDPAKLKEIKREEEIAKAKQALERKKKLAEKAAAKAALRAQKEAEKKLKDREKKAKKKASGTAAVSNPEDEPKDEVVEAIEPEEVSDDVQAPAPVKFQKESGIRSRSRARGPDSIPKVILKRKKPNNYWVWIAAAALLVLLLVVCYSNSLIASAF
ncbi:Proton pump-interactor 1, partial [Mucuna pruriens]